MAAPQWPKGPLPLSYRAAFDAAVFGLQGQSQGVDFDQPVGHSPPLSACKDKAGAPSAAPAKGLQRLGPRFALWIRPIRADDLKNIRLIDIPVPHVAIELYAHRRNVAAVLIVWVPIFPIPIKIIPQVF